ncbi:MAG: inositol monophosphatase family protein [Bradymonadia bacterium]
MLSVASKAAITAGELLRGVFFDHDRAADAVENADIAAEDLIYEALCHEFPTMGFRMEERPERNQEAAPGCEYTWLIDPHDGTTAAKSGWRGASVSIGCIKGDRPVLGVVYAYAYPDNSGDLIAWAEGCGPLKRNGSELRRNGARRPLLLVSKHADRFGDLYSKTFQPSPYECLPGVAYRLARVAAADGQCAISLHGPRDFDCLGGHALLIGSGADLFDSNGKPIRYSASTAERYGACFGGQAAVAKQIYQADWQKLRSPTRVATPLVEPRADRLLRDNGLLTRGRGALIGLLATDHANARHSSQLAGEGKPQSTFTACGEMSLSLARSILAAGGYSADAAASAYQRWLTVTTNPVTDSTRYAIRKGYGSAAAVQRHADPNSQDHTALMRCVPIALLGVGQAPEDTARWLQLDARLTHSSAHCLESCRLYGQLLSGIVEQGLCAKAASQYAEHLLEGTGFSRELKTAVQCGLKKEADPWNRVEGHALASLQVALSHLKQGLKLEAVLKGTPASDMHSAAALPLYGALYGAIHGFSSVPTWARETILTQRARNTPSAAPLWEPSLSAVDALIIAEQLTSIVNKQEA